MLKFEPCYVETDRFNDSVRSPEELRMLIEIHGGDIERLKQLRKKEMWPGYQGHLTFGEGAGFSGSLTFGERYSKSLLFLSGKDYNSVCTNCNAEFKRSHGFPCLICGSCHCWKGGVGEQCDSCSGSGD